MAQEPAGDQDVLTVRAGPVVIRSLFRPARARLTTAQLRAQLEALDRVLASHSPGQRANVGTSLDVMDKATGIQVIHGRST